MLARRGFLRLGFGLAAGAALADSAGGALAALAPAAPRTVAFHNLHTGEALDAIYYEDGRYVPGALQAVNHLLRDFRTGDVHVIDPNLLDTLHALARNTGTRNPFQVISGYRSPRTNAMLHERSEGVASHSLHMQGMAIDIRLADGSLGQLHNAALSLQAGGVGFYPESDFVHVDVGRVRRWQGV
jgi:uncharacterized protein YcbK (DUF882 family)